MHAPSSLRIHEVTPFWQDAKTKTVVVQRVGTSTISDRRRIFELFAALMVGLHLYNCSECRFKIAE
jgi:hypothetical protein